MKYKIYRFKEPDFILKYNYSQMEILHFNSCSSYFCEKKVELILMEQKVLSVIRNNKEPIDTEYFLDSLDFSKIKIPKDFPKTPLILEIENRIYQSQYQSQYQPQSQYQYQPQPPFETELNNLDLDYNSFFYYLNVVLDFLYSFIN